MRRIPALLSALRHRCGLLLAVVLLPCLLGFSFPGTVQRVWRQADRAFGRKQFDRARDLYNQARRDRPQDWRLMHNATVAAAANKDYEQAIKDFQTIATSGPQEMREAAEFNTGNCYLAQQKPDQAIEHYKRALYLKPDDLNAKWNLELAKRKQQEQKKQQQQQKKPDQPQNKPQDQKQQQQQKKQQQQQQQQEQQQQMNREQAKQLLRSLSQEDKDLQKKLSKYRNRPSGETRPQKDW